MSDINLVINEQAASLNLGVVQEPNISLSLALVGAQGIAGPGVVGGGVAGEILIKKTNTNYDTEWVNNIDGGEFF